MQVIKQTQKDFNQSRSSHDMKFSHEMMMARKYIEDDSDPLAVC